MIKDRIGYEQKVIRILIGIYCEGKHGSAKGALCETCEDLNNYAQERIMRCPHGEEKTFCANCSTHCYRATPREKVKEVMRYSGPRIMKSHPILGIMHLVENRKEKKRLGL